MDKSHDRSVGRCVPFGKVTVTLCQGKGNRVLHTYAVVPDLPPASPILPLLLS